MNTASRIQFVAAAFTLVLAVGCSDQAPAKSGDATLSLVSPNAKAGAISLLLTGPGLSDVKSASSAYLVYSRVASPSEARLIIVGDLTPGAVASVHVEDVSHLGQYAAQVLEVATRSDAPASTSGYRITLARQ